ncbi:DEAD/DEAH box helicase [Gammaproteobacteria bacterium]|nr:DEAD/DEAH box helicase [Gammaproteobacteria bacterium]
MKSDSPKNNTGLADFHPASRAWFEERFGQATKAQADAWPQIRAGRHTLIAAPTGSGKTLAAFYAAIDMLLQRGLNGELSEGVQILYVSPLKALSNDIQKNLEQPLNGIAEQLHLQGFAPVDIRIAVRTGDTPPIERARMAKKPPHILVTTPESFYLLLTSASGRAMLSTVRSLVVDEIHALLGDKRGSHLALSMERLQHLISSQSSGNTKDQSGRKLQRIGLSATQKPIDLVANYLVGNATGQSECDSGSLGEVEVEVEVEGADSRWPKADCAIVDSGFRRELDIRIEVPKSPLSALMSNEVWDELYGRLVELIESHDTTLVFVNTRRLSERLALALAERLGDDVVCSHHGSMSKDHRHNAEQRLKAGSLKVLVATASMELGIDVGSVDLVVQFSSPKSIATFLQRVGRSGHSINGTPKGILFPLTRDDLIEASALVHSIRRGQLDAIVMPEKPLDILAQQIVAEVSAQVHDRGRDGDTAGDEPGQRASRRDKSKKLSAPDAPEDDLWAQGADDSGDVPANKQPVDKLSVQNQPSKVIFQPLATALAAMRTSGSTRLSSSAKPAPTPASPEVRKAALAAARAGLRGTEAEPASVKSDVYPKETEEIEETQETQEIEEIDEIEQKESFEPMTPLDSWCIDELYALVIKAFPFRELTKEEFEETLRMVADGYTSRRGRRGAHLHYDAINRRLRPRRGANLIALTNGGAIPDMFDYQVVLDPEDTVVGSLNEDFALDSMAGDVFTLGTHAWQILRVDGLKVRVRDAQGMNPTVPFWFGEGPGRTVELSQSVSNFRQQIGDLILDESADAAMQWCINAVGLPHSAASQVVEYLHAGMAALGAMPTRDTIIMERFFDEVGDMHVVIHSPFGSRINRGWGLALRKRFCKSFNFELQAAANEDSIVISLGSVHSFPLDEVFRYLQTTTVRDVLVQALLDSPMFEVRWRWNATRSLAIQRNRSGKRVPPQFQRMDAEDLIAHVFPDQIACAENLTGRRDVPTHPLVDQTIHDCLTEAMDIDALIELVGKIEREELTLIAKDLREPSPFAQEIINARPYAFLDDAPAEERRTNAIRNRSWADPAEARDYSLLDVSAIARVREEAWPLVHNAEELHDALQTLGYITAAEFADNGFEKWRERLVLEGRLHQLVQHPQELLFATEDLPKFRALFPECCAQFDTPSFLEGVCFEPEEALRDLVRSRLEGLGPVTAQRLADEVSLPCVKIDAALLALEVEGFVFQGKFTPRAEQAGDGPVEWCERRLLQRIHRYTIDSHRKAIKPVSLQVYTQFLFDEHGLQPVRDDDEMPHSSAEASLDGQTQLQRSLAMLDGISAPAASWEADLYPSRVSDYDPNWLDVLCISGRVTWGRYVQPSASQRALHKGSSGPVKTTPIAIMSRANLDIWQAMARAQLKEADEGPRKTRVGQDAPSGKTFSNTAQRIEADLLTNGASFFDQIQSRSGLLKAQLEEGLAELVGAGRLNSDSFTGLRALLTPAAKKQSAHRRRRRSPMFGVEEAGRWSLLETFAPRPADTAETEAMTTARTETEAETTRRSPATPAIIRQPRATRPNNSRSGWDVFDDDQLERLISIYLNRWGVLFRSIIERELLAPPWRVLLRALRRLELRGTVRGGRFIAGVGGEQFAFQEAVDGLRSMAKEVAAAKPRYHSLAASDPLNLLNLILPRRKLAKLLNNRVLFEDGIPIAVVESGEVKFLREVAPEKQWALQQALVQKNFPPRLRSYLGAGKATLK